MKSRPKYLVLLLLLAAVGTVSAACLLADPEDKKPKTLNYETVELPAPHVQGDISLEEALAERRSIRSYREEPLTLPQISQLLWAAQGITETARGFRTAPSAGALYPLEVYLLAGNVKELTAGIYHYQPKEHKLLQIKEGDSREELFEVSLRQSPVKNAPGVLVFSAVLERTTGRYGERGVRYVHMEAGHASQNVYLQAVSLELGTVVIGAFEDEGVRKVLSLPEREEPLYIMPVGVI